jgi:enolase
MESIISKVRAREVLDSRGNPTVECEVLTSDNIKGRFIVPSGASTGEFEAVELRDEDSRYLGKGVLTAIKNIETIIGPKIIGRSVFDQKELDNFMIELDGTDNKAKLGANAILGVSIAVAKAASRSKKMYDFEYLGANTRLPCPMLNVINGGKHAGGDLAIQEFMILPYGFDTFKEGLRASAEAYQQLKKFLKNKYGSPAINVGDEGGFAPSIQKTVEAIQALEESINMAGYQMGEHFGIGIDAASSEFYNNGKYSIDGTQLTPDEMIDFYASIVEEYPYFISIEDPFDENDYDSFSKLVSSIGNKVAIVGDDLTVTNVKRISKAIEKKSMNYLLLKINQIGTLSESIQAFDLTKSQGWGVVISHRSGDTEDVFIADLSVGLGAERIKTGAPARSERVAKYNQLLRIEETLGDKATYFQK